MHIDISTFISVSCIKDSAMRKHKGYTQQRLAFIHAAALQYRPAHPGPLCF